MRRFPFAFLLVGLLGLLAAGGAVLGAFEAPTATDLAVHNAAGETLAAPTVVGVYQASNLVGESIDFVFTAPDKAFEQAKAPNGKVKAHRTVYGATAVGILQPIRALKDFHHFTAQGNVYTTTESVKKLVPAAQRPSVSGTYRARVELEGGYVVRIDVAVHAIEQNQHVVETLDYRLTRVGSWTRR